MRGILIDPVNREVSEIEVDQSVQDSLAPLYELLTIEGSADVDLAERIRLPQNQYIWVDGEGWLKPETARYSWLCTWLPQAIAGKAVILGEARSGEHTISTSLSVEDVRKAVHF